MKISTNTPQHLINLTPDPLSQEKRPPSSDTYERTKTSKLDRATGRLKELDLATTKKPLNDLGPDAFGLEMMTPAKTDIGATGYGFGMTSDPRQKGDAGENLSSNGEKSFSDRLSDAFNAGLAALGAAAGMGSNLNVPVGVIAGAGTTAEIAAATGAVGLAGAAGVAVGLAVDAGITESTGKTLGDHVYEALNSDEIPKPETKPKADSTMPHEGSATLPKGLTVPPSRIERTGMTTRRELATRETDAHGDRIPFDQSLVQDRLTRRLTTPTDPTTRTETENDKVRVASSKDGLRRSLDNVILPSPVDDQDRNIPVKKKTLTGPGGLK